LPRVANWTQSRLAGRQISLKKSVELNILSRPSATLSILTAVYRDLRLRNE
jgi:hypothetical protein